MENVKTKFSGKKLLKALATFVLMVVIAVVVTLFIHNGDNKPASVEIKNGLSAYELAVQYGYDGTVEEWLKTLNGKSAYEIAVDNGYSGSEKDWSASLKATAGKDGVGIKTASFSSAGELVIKLSDGTTINVGKVVGADGKDGVNGVNGKDGVDGKDGADGKDGVNGTNGADGVGISSANINADGQLVLTFSDGTTVNLDKVVGVNGVDGVSVTNSEINANGELVLTYSNGQIANLGVVVGADGKDGVDGKDGADGKDGINGTNGIDGKDGISVVKSEINSKGELVLTYSDNTVDNLGVVVGANGKDGIDGKDGADGKDGINGQDGKDGKDGVNGANGEDGVGIETIVINANGELEITLTSGTTMNLGNIKGADGKDGQNGKDGVDGVNGQDGKDGIDGINGQDGKEGKDGLGVASTTINNNGELVIEYTDGTIENLGKVVGKDGANGTNGINGTNGTDGVDGIGVTKTEINADGELIIYYSNNTSENLGVVVGADGKDGINGQDGKDGIDGVNGQDGKDGIDGINGQDGKDGVDGKDGIGISDVEINADNELVLTFSDNSTINLGNIKGADGKDGVNGQNGKDGVDGVGIANVTISPEGALTVELTNGTILNLGNIKGENGIGISKSEINADGELVLTYTNGQTANLGVVVGADGKDGTNGTNGVDGVGIKTVTLSTDGELSILMTDNSTYNLGNIKGEKGDKGDKGETGEAGRGIKKMEIINGELMVTYTDSDIAVSVGKVTSSSVNTGLLDQDGGTPELAYYPFINNNGELNLAVAVGTATLLENIVIPSSHNGKPVTAIAADAFFDNEGTMKTITIPNTVTYYNNNAFDNISTAKAVALREVYYTGTVEEWVTKTVFARTEDGYMCSPIYGNSNALVNSQYYYSPKFYIDGEFVKNLKIPNTVTKINTAVFNEYFYLESVVIPTSVTEIGAKAFYISKGIKVFYEGTSTQLDNVKKTNNWISSKAKVYYYSETQPTTTGNFWHYVDGEATAW